MAGVVLYHRITETACDPWGLNVSAGHFAEHLEVLRARWQPASLIDLAVAAAGSLSDRRIAVTFDDGYADNLYTALPILNRHGVDATFFVPSGQSGTHREFWWDELERVLLHPGVLPERLELTIQSQWFRWDLGEAALYTDRDAALHRRWVAWEPPPTTRHALYVALWQRCHEVDAATRGSVVRRLHEWAELTPIVRSSHRVIDPGEMAALARAPGAVIGGHTLSHPRLAGLTPTEQTREIVDDKTTLERIVGEPVLAFAYPFGKRSDYDDATLACLRSAGFVAACINEPGRVTDVTPRLELPRLFVRDVDGDTFDQWLSSALA